MLQVEHSEILLRFIKVPNFIKIFVLSIYELPFYTDFTVSYLRNAYMKLEPVTNAKKSKQKTVGQHSYYESHI